MASADTKALIDQAVRNFQAEVPALANLKLVIALELRGGRDVQHYRVELPGPKVTKDPPPDAKVRLEVPRADFNQLAVDGGVAGWRRAFESGRAKASGPDQILRLVTQVVEKQEERTRARRARSR